MYKNKLGDSIFKEKMLALIKSDKYISERKVKVTYDEVFRELGEERQKSITPEKKEILLKELYKNAENAFIKRISSLIDAYTHKDEKEEQEFIEKVRSAYKKYCSNSGLKQDKNLSSEEAAQQVIEERRKENNFIGTVILLNTKYNSKDDELLLEYIDDIKLKYGEDDIISYIEKAGRLYGLADFEIESLKDHIKGVDINAFICRKNLPLFSLYRFYKSDKYNERIDPDDDGIIDLDDYAYIQSSRAAAASAQIGVKWIVNSYLDTYLVFPSSHTYSKCQDLSKRLEELSATASEEERVAKARKRFEEAEKRKAQELIDNEENQEEDNDPLYTIRKYAKKLSDLIQENNADISSTAQITSQEVDKYTDVLEKIIDGDSTEEEKQKKLLRKIDDQTPTTTSDRIIDDLIEKINDPTISISPREILEELITDSREVQISRNDKIANLISKLGMEICNVLDISDEDKKQELIRVLNDAINDDRTDIKEKNEFFMPQLAKQLGIETAVFYKTTKTNDSSTKAVSAESIVNILRDNKLVDDTRFHLTKNFIKPNERYIVANNFVKNKKDSGMIEMKHILESTEKYVRDNYKSKGFSKKEADEAYKNIRIGIIKQSLFNKLVNNSDESNDTWGLIEDENGKLRLSPMFNFKHCAGYPPSNPRVRVVDKNKNYIDDFLIVYSSEDWFKEWIDNAVINLDFDKASDEMTRKTGVILTPKEKEYYRKMIFDKMHSIIVNASEVNYDTEEIIRARKERMSVPERIIYSGKTIRSKLSRKKNSLVKTLKPSKRPSNDDQER